MPSILGLLRCKGPTKLDSQATLKMKSVGGLHVRIRHTTH